MYSEPSELMPRRGIFWPSATSSDHWRYAPVGADTPLALSGVLIRHVDRLALEQAEKNADLLGYFRFAAQADARKGEVEDCVVRRIRRAGKKADSRSRLGRRQSLEGVAIWTSALRTGNVVDDPLNETLRRRWRAAEGRGTKLRRTLLGVKDPDILTEPVEPAVGTRWKRRDPQQ